MARQMARINAGNHPFTVNPLKRPSASLIIIADTNNLTTKVIRPSVIIFSGNRIRKPIVAFKIPITKATNIALV